MLIQDVTGELAESFGMDRPRGALVARALPNSPSAKARLQVGDVILMLNNQDVENVARFNKLVKNLPAGKTVAVLVHRNTAPIFLPLRLPEE